MNESTILAAVHIRLSSEGQKAAILAGKNAAREQIWPGQIPTSDLDLCEIQPDGSVDFWTYGRTKMPQYLVDYHDLSVIVHGSLTMDFDRLPADAAAAVAEFRAYGAANRQEIEESSARQRAEKQTKDDAHLEAEKQAVERFLAGPDERGAHTGGRVYLAAPEGLFDVQGSVPGGGRAIYIEQHPMRAQVAAEIERRNAGDKQAAERAEAERVQEKAEALTAWLRTHGTQNQIERHEAGVLPILEAMETLANVTFAPLDGFARYTKITDQEVYMALDEEYTNEETQFRSVDAEKLTAAQWDLLKQIRAAFPQGTVVPKIHEASVKHDDVGWGVVERMSALASCTVAGINLRREYALPPEVPVQL